MNSIVRRNSNGASLMSDFDRILAGIFDDVPVWNTRMPAVDVQETEDQYIVEADLPGMDEKDIQVKVENDLLTISSEKFDEKNEKRNGYLLRERNSRSFRRSFALPKDVDREHIEAGYRNGVLKLQLQKLPEAKPRTIKVKVE